jgi:N-acetylglucosaminyldiphosphoundecaprenol N-acetyl-beta-D-mannosaminyltransferase
MFIVKAAPVRTEGSQKAASSISAVPILGVGVCQLTQEQAVQAIDRLATDGVRQMLVYVNTHTLNLAVHDRELRDALNRSALVMNDGIGVSLAARMRKERFPENLNGSDFTVRLLQLAAANQWGVFLFGGEPGIAETASERLSERIEGLRIVGTCHGFTGESDDLVARRVRDAGAAMLIVALGSPAQEIWIDRKLAATGALVGVGVGAFLDFSAGKVVRAPRWMNVVGIEWCFRLIQEPRRLWRRYVVGNPLFLLRAWRSRHESMSPSPAPYEREKNAPTFAVSSGGMRSEILRDPHLPDPHRREITERRSHG